jgi:hypothetical protein
MSDTLAEQVALTPNQAVREILKIEGHTESLFQRTVGMTWMIWAVINGGIFVSYEAIGLAAPPGTLAIFGYGVVWLPWMLLGSVSTTVLWRSLALVVPRDWGIGARRATAVATMTFLALVLGGLAVISLANVHVNGPFWAMFAVGIAAAAVGGSGLTTESRSERVLWLVGGVVLAVLAVGIDLVAGRIGYDPLGLLLVVGPVASTALLFGGGLYTALT